ncbi:MAG: hypothetical protein GY832_43720 [Chloroflexi bacterium]|nr:hypothetical protein [Chloroflexota bacterium]
MMSRKEMPTERKKRLQTTIDVLTRERIDLTVQLEAATLTGEQIQTKTEFAKRVNGSLDIADTEFEKQRRLIELVDVQAALTVKDGERVIYVR